MIVDGQEYKPGDVIPDFKSIKCVDTREPRKYQGLSADVSVLNDVIAKYASGGASCFMSDTGEYYEYDRKEKAWKLITNITERGFDSEKAYGALKHMLKNVTVSDEKIQSAVTNYLTVNPVLPGATTEQAQQIEQNKTDVASLKEETGSLREEIDNVENDTLTVSQGYIPIKLIADKFLSSSGITDYTGWSATENIKVDGLDYIYTEWSKASSYNKFLDSNFGLVKMVTIKDGLQKTNVPEGASYVAFSNETTVMEGLRVWSSTKANSYENTLEISKLKQDIPLYYEKHLTDKITEVRAKETFSGVSGDEFIFITDYHMERNANNSPSLIDKIIHQTGAKKIVFGGDAYDASSTPDLALNKIADFYSMFYENVDKILSCVGNHEYNNPASNKPEQQIPNGQVYESIVNRNDLIHHSRYTCNYTILNRSNRTMYIFIGCEYSSSVTKESIKYILETLKNNDGYDIIVFSHTGLDNGGDNGNVANIIDGFKRITDGIDKFNQKSSYVFDGITYDYSGCTGEVICVFSGHNHVDGCIRTDGGLNVISTTCDAYGAPEGGVVRTKGTITEQAFDVVNIDYENKKIYMTRVGAGEDRVFSY